MRDFLVASATLALVAATPALAQTEPQEPTPAPDAATAQRGGDIVVTARRREESIRDVPGTISAVTGDQLEAKGPVTGTTDLLATVPGVRFNDVSSENLGEVSVRGSGTQRATGADSGVGLFVNGAYVGSSTLGGRNFKTLDYFDVERVEALEGPQGALYGRNSEFGVVNIVLAKPKFDSSGYVRNMFTFGMNQNRISGVINEAISDTEAVRIGGEIYGQSRGFYYDPNHDRYYDSTKGWVFRGQLRHRSGPVDITLMFDAQDLNLPSFVNSFVVPGGGVNPQLPLGFVQDRFVIPHEGRDGLQQKVKRLMVLASYDLGFATLDSTTMATSWRSSQQFAGAIDMATLSQLRAQGQIGAYPFAQTTTDVRDRTLYQDLHLSGKSGDGAFNWVVGGEVLMQKDEYDRTSATSPCAFTLNASICTGTPTAPVCLKPLPTSLNCPATFPLGFGQDGRVRQRIFSAAAYASLQYSTGNFTFAGEGRITHDYKTARETVYSLYTTNLFRPVSVKTFKKQQPAWTFTVNYKTDDASRTLLYAKVGTGYRAGGVNNGTFNAAAPNPFRDSYDNEDTIGYEVGVKSNITRNVFARASAYLSRTHNAITSINDGCTLTNACAATQQFFNVNGGTIQAKGVEVAIDARFEVAGGRLSLGANAATQEAHFEEVQAGVPGLPILGSRVAQIPDWTFSANVNYRAPIAPDAAVFFNLSWTGQRGGGQDAVTVATPYIPMDSFDLFGARAGFDIGKAQIAGFVRNFTDQEVQLLKFQQAGYPLSVRYNKPRTFGVTASYRW